MGGMGAGGQAPIRGGGIGGGKEPIKPELAPNVRGGKSGTFPLADDVITGMAGKGMREGMSPGLMLRPSLL